MDNPYITQKLSLEQVGIEQPKPPQLASSPPAKKGSRRWFMVSTMIKVASLLLLFTIPFLLPVPVMVPIAEEVPNTLEDVILDHGRLTWDMVILTGTLLVTATAVTVVLKNEKQRTLSNVLKHTAAVILTVVSITNLFGMKGPDNAEFFAENVCSTQEEVRHVTHDIPSIHDVDVFILTQLEKTHIEPLISFWKSMMGPPKIDIEIDIEEIVNPWPLSLISGPEPAQVQTDCSVSTFLPDQMAESRPGAVIVIVWFLASYFILLGATNFVVFIVIGVLFGFSIK